ncbi:MAG: GMC oxidoreductase [Patulibacter minatonensis]
MSPIADTRLSRRTLLTGAAATTVALAAGWPRSAGAATIPSRTERRKVVVLGTGFGGSVTALRLAQAGVNVTMIERGRRWPAGQPDTFPTFRKFDQRGLWMGGENAILPGILNPPIGQKYAGLVEFIKGNGLDVACPAAVGGGSLPYHGMTFQPRADLFERVMPKELDYEELDRDYYPLAMRMLKASAMPADVLASDRYASSRRFQAFVKRAGLPDAAPIPMVIDWDVVRRELRGELPGLISKGDVVLGVNGPGKHSLDTNYLKDAEATGRVELLALHQVKSIARDARGGWVLAIERIDVRGRVLERITLTAETLFLGAGAPNTTRLLVRAAGRGDITDLPDEVGGSFSGNGDQIVAQVLSKPMGTWQGGPANVATTDWDNPVAPATLLFAPIPLPVEANTMITVAMAIPDSLGRWRYDSRRDAAILDHRNALKGTNAASASRSLKRIAKAAGVVGTLDATRLDPLTFHPLGGAVLGTVTDAYGRVHGQDGLYVIDGALIPGSTACANPSLTIAALAERNVAQILKTDRARLL